jgi:uncharacterized membrane protein YqgA involved in biofilm formation
MAEDRGRVAVPVGTLTNIATVLVGTTIGAVAGARFPERIRTTVLAALGLLTAAVGVREIMPTDEFPLVLGAVLLGALIGETIRIEGGLTAFGEMLQRRFAGDAGDSRFSEGFVIASLVFCIGPLTIVGSIEDGLGDPELLLVKAGLDGFASIAFAAVYGWGVGLSAITVALIQGGIALGAGALDGVLTDPMLDALGAAGGILLLGIALRLLDLKEIRVANLLPAIVLAPLFVRWWG